MLPHKTTSSELRVAHLTSAHSAFDVRILHKECQSLAGAGYKVVEIANYPENTVFGAIEIRGLGRSRGRLHRVTTKLVGMAREALRIDADVYHIHDPELLVVAVFLRACGKRVVYDIHEDLPRTVTYKRYVPAQLQRPLIWLLERAENLAARCMSSLVAATPTIGARFQSINPNTVVVNNYPLLNELVPAAPVSWSSRERSVAYIGGIASERGIHEMLAAMHHIQPPLCARLELAGRFFVDGLEGELCRKPEWRHVNWRGVLDRKRISDLLARVRAGLVVLHPEQNFVVSQPVKLFEYMAAGIPVIASDFPLWRRIIGEANCGILVDPQQPAHIAEAIEYLLTHDSEAEAMGRRGRKAIEEHFNWQHEEQTLLHLYSSLTPTCRQNLRQ
jgi:glycosyltransferase involved in cell wall biosynthesis